MRRPGLNYDQSSPLAGVGSLLLRAAGTVGYPLGVRLSTLKTPLTRRTVQAQLFGEHCFVWTVYGCARSTKYSERRTSYQVLRIRRAVLRLRSRYFVRDTKFFLDTRSAGYDSRVLRAESRLR